jgi:hypothetical protein
VIDFQSIQKISKSILEQYGQDLPVPIQVAIGAPDNAYFSDTQHLEFLRLAFFCTGPGGALFRTGGGSTLFGACGAGAPGGFWGGGRTLFGRSRPLFGGCPGGRFFGSRAAARFLELLDLFF